MIQDELVEQEENLEIGNNNPETIETDNESLIALAQQQFAEALALSNQLLNKSKAHTLEVNELLAQALKLDTEVSTYIIPKK